MNMFIRLEKIKGNEEVRKIYTIRYRTNSKCCPMSNMAISPSIIEAGATTTAKIWIFIG